METQSKVSVTNWLLCLIAALLVANSYLLMTTLREVKLRIPIVENGTSLFVRSADDLLDNGNEVALRELSLKRVSAAPLDTYGHWYLGRAYFLKQEWSNAIASFARSVELDPRFADSARPYVDAAQLRLEGNRSRTMQSSVPVTRGTSPAGAGAAPESPVR